MSVHLHWPERVQHHARMEALVRTVLAPITVTVLKDILARVVLRRVSIHDCCYKLQVVIVMILTCLHGLIYVC